LRLSSRSPRVSSDDLFDSQPFDLSSIGDDPPLVKAEAAFFMK
jgi:hypothetical protein